MQAEAPRAEQDGQDGQDERLSLRALALALALGGAGALLARSTVSTWTSQQQQCCRRHSRLWTCRTGWTG